MARITGPTGQKHKLGFPCIRNAVRGISGYVVNRSWRHRFLPGFAAFCHQDQRALALHGRVVLSAIADAVKMSVRHKILRSDFARLEDGGSPEETSFCARSHGLPELHAVDQGFGIEGSSRGFIAK